MAGFTGRLLAHVIVVWSVAVSTHQIAIVWLVHVVHFRQSAVAALALFKLIGAVSRRRLDRKSVV